MIPEAGNLRPSGAFAFLFWVALTYTSPLVLLRGSMRRPLRELAVCGLHSDS